MYVLGENAHFVSQIVKALEEPSDDVAYLVERVQEIRSRKPVLYAAEPLNVETVKNLFIVAKGTPLIVVKKQWTPEEIETVDNAASECSTECFSIWNNELAKLKDFDKCRCSDERVATLSKWIGDSPPRVFFLAFSEASLKESVLSLLHRSRAYRFLREQSLSLNQKPPALHWTNFPREDELQMTFKFTFPTSWILDSEVQGLFERAIAVRHWSYCYEWMEGVLLKEDPVKIAITKHSSELLEVSGRVDKAELDDDVEETPMKPVWPHLSRILNVTLKYFEELSLPFQLHMLPIGDFFYAENGTIARSFDLTQLLVSVNLLSRVAFRSNDKLCHLRLDRIFLGEYPKCLDDIAKAEPLKEVKAEEDDGKQLGDAPSPTLLCIEKNAAHRGRRVSFGAIRCIPQSAFPKSEGQSSSPAGDDPVNEFVDRILGETLKQLVIR